MMFDEQSFEDMYRATDALWSGRANVQMVREVADLPPGTALDVGCGEGADAIWLAVRGWRVTAVDFAATALERAADAATAAGVADRIDWVRADVTRWTPDPDSFDLVSAQYMHLLPDQRGPLFTRLAAAVRPGGTLLVVGHDIDEVAAGAHHHPAPERFFTAEEVARLLDPDAWRVEVAESRPRPAGGREGEGHNMHDAVLRARNAKGDKNH
jgi:SAM-dependent methyltransferase